MTKVQRAEVRLLKHNLCKLTADYDREERFLARTRRHVAAGLTTRGTPRKYRQWTELNPRPEPKRRHVRDTIRYRQRTLPGQIIKHAQPANAARYRRYLDSLEYPEQMILLQTLRTEKHKTVKGWINRL